jgi:hypothetical protein
MLITAPVKAPAVLLAIEFLKPSLALISLVSSKSSNSIAFPLASHFVALYGLMCAKVVLSKTLSILYYYLAFSKVIYMPIGVSPRSL